MPPVNIHSKAMDKPTSPIDLLVCAIATMEGWFEVGTIPNTHHNPGDLRFANQLNAIEPPNYKPGLTPPPIATFTSAQAGIVALYRQVLLQVAEGQTVTQIVRQWAPPNDGNNTSVYLANVLKWTGLPLDVPVMTLIPGLVRLY